MERKIKTGLSFFIFLVLLLPLAQQCAPFFESEMLHGAGAAPDAKFGFSEWMNGSYQRSKENFVNDNNGLRSDLVRMNNEIDFALFRKLHGGVVVLGKEHCLYQYPYIDSYYGIDYVGHDTIVEKCRKLRALQDTLARLGKSLILAHAPCKAYYWPEYFPEDSRRPYRGSANFDVYLHVADSMGINQVDFNTWFVAMKGKSKELMYSKQGIHWSIYGAILAGDSLVRYVEKLRHIRMVHFQLNNVVHTSKARYTDDDIAKILNLAVPVTREVFAYPDVNYIPDPYARKPRMIFIGDSFLWSWMSIGTMENVTSYWEYWNYFSTVFNYEYPASGVSYDIKDWNWRAALDSTDCVVIMYTAQNLKQLGSGFIEQAYDRYYPKK